LVVFSAATPGPLRGFAADVVIGTIPRKVEGFSNLKLSIETGAGSDVSLLHSLVGKE
jgi:hypothetical protein